jgi:ketosteroid isomerase-like protein
MMANDEEEVLAATRRFYDAIEDLVTGRGLDAMSRAWHHTASVSSSHPMGDWAHGWDEVWATWQVIAPLGGPENKGSSIREVRAHVYGDTAYVTLTFVSAPALGAVPLSCTNVLVKADGAWKIVHHHADKSPGLEQALTKLAAEG